MRSLDMLLKRAEVEICVRTTLYLALVLVPFWIMDLYVLFQITFRRKLLWTIRTIILLLPLVDLLVPNEVGHLSEGLAASRGITLVRPLPVMDSLVFLQRGALGESLVTPLAFKISGLVCLLVVLKEASRRKLSTAYFTNEIHVYCYKYLNSQFLKEKHTNGLNLKDCFSLEPLSPLDFLYFKKLTPTSLVNRFLLSFTLRIKLLNLSKELLNTEVLPFNS